MEISILHKANSLQVTEMTTCLRVSHGKALPSILEIAPNFGHDTNALTVFRSSCTTRSRPALQESCSTRQESRSMGRVSREGGNLLFSSTVDIPFESKDNYTILQMYIIQ